MSTAIFRMQETDRIRVASRYVGRRVVVAWNYRRGPASEDATLRGYLVSLARIPGGASLVVLSQRLTADGIGDTALPLSQVRSILPDTDWESTR